MTDNTTATVARHDLEIRRAVRRPLAIWAVVGYPIGVLVLTQLPASGVPAWVSGIAGLAIILSSLPAMYLVWRFRGQLAQAPDGQLDERQIAIRDRAYLVSYRIFVAVVLAAMVVVGIGSDVLDRQLSLGYDTLNWYVMGIILLSSVLPSAVVAWQERDLPSER